MHSSFSSSSILQWESLVAIDSALEITKQAAHN